MKVGFISLGCPKNLVDSEVMMGHLKHKEQTMTTISTSATGTSLTQRAVLNGALTLTMMLLATMLAFAQDLDMDCRPILSIPPQCQQIARDLAAREDSYRSRIEVLQDRLKEAPPSQRQSL